MGNWTADDVPDLSGHIAVVTGANSGIGLPTARELARHGARVVVATRSAARGEAAIEQIRAAVPGAAVETSPLDLADLASIRRFAATVAEAHGGLDLLVNNAGVMMVPRQPTADGFEMQLGTNHLGHFALTGLLLPALLARPGARVVTVSSGMHHRGRIDFDDLMGERRYRPTRAYAQSKLANLLFTFELQRRIDAAGADLRAVAAHPGFAATNLGHSGGRLIAWAVRLGQALRAQSAEMGALPTLYAATAPDVAGGEYFGPDGKGEERGYPVRVPASARARDEADAARLWEISERLTGVRFEVPATR
jgi:NAD(P)-dependent dehydrogenase (short-subunit alcohol dehydrogenase family)